MLKKCHVYSGCRSVFDATLARVGLQSRPQQLIGTVLLSRRKKIEVRGGSINPDCEIVTPHASRNILSTRLRLLVEYSAVVIQTSSRFSVPAAPLKYDEVFLYSKPLPNCDQ